MTRVLVRKGQAPPPSSGIRGLGRLLEQERRTCPRFSHYWLNLVPPRGAKLLEEYEVSRSKVRIFSLRGDLDLLYHLIPWEYTLDEGETALVASAVSKVMASPPLAPSLDEGDLRRHVRSCALADLRAQVRRSGGMASMDPRRAEERLSALAEVVSRYTAGLGLFEHMLADRRLEDIYVDAPCGKNPVHVTLSGLAGRNSVSRCTTNVLVDEREVRAFVARMKFHSGRAFSEAMPVLETDVPGFGSRATVIGAPLSPQGLALALRRHAPEPWTLMRLVHSGLMDCYTAALISFLVDGRSTLLVCGPRGAGKSSLLGAILFEFPPGQRVLTIEDTAELPVRQMQSLGYKVQSLLIDGATGSLQEARAEEALRVSLRMGESAIVLGEVRGREAQVLYDSMRTGKAGSSVLGTIHGESARSVYERVVHDMGIAPEAFQATDAVLTLGLVRPKGAQRPLRRLVELAEVVRERPGEFREMARMRPDGSAELVDRGSDLIGRIARSWGVGSEEALENVLARAGMREILLAAARSKGMEYLSPQWTTIANSFLWEGLEEGLGHSEVVDGFRAKVNGGAG